VLLSTGGALKYLDALPRSARPGQASRRVQPFLDPPEHAHEVAAPDLRDLAAILLSAEKGHAGARSLSKPSMPRAMVEIGSDADVVDPNLTM
jgi:hypothetical protein